MTAKKKETRRGLGRGLSALMADVTPAATASGATDARNPDKLIPIEDILPNPDQPRRHFAQAHLDELAASIRTKGVLQPLIVRPDPQNDGKFQIVAGERRWRAAQLAQQHELPVIIREFDDTEVLEVAIIENIQRADLNAIEEAAGYKQLMYKFGHTQEKLAEALGKSRSHIANLMRLLNLPETVQSLVAEGTLSAGHARALVTSDDPEGLARLAVARKLSVREMEKLSKSSNKTEKRRKRSPDSFQMDKDADTRALEGDLTAALGMKVRIDHPPGQESGKVMISYDTLEHLDALCAILSTAR